MSLPKKIIITLPILFLVYIGVSLYFAIAKSKSEDPLVWEDAIEVLEKKLVANPAKEDSILFIGSSSIRFWDSIAEDMKPFDVVQRGFGGAKFLDVVHYADRLLDIGVNPSAIVLFVGTNDIHPGAVKEPTLLLQRYQEFLDVVRSAHANVPVYYIAITPSEMRWEVWNVAQQTNQLITEYSASQENLFVIDTSSRLLGSDGQPNTNMYRFDGLHLNKAGYAQWTEVILSRLLADLW